MTRFLALVLSSFLCASVASAQGQPSVEQVWVRASVPGQQATGAFMRITAKEPMQLVGVSTPVAGVAEVHEMKMEGDVMRMRPAGPVDLPVGRAFELKPGGYHIMLQDLKKPLQAGANVPITLVFRNAKGAESRLEVHAPVALQAPAATAAAGAMPAMPGIAPGAVTATGALTSTRLSTPFAFRNTSVMGTVVPASRGFFKSCSMTW